MLLVPEGLDEGFFDLEVVKCVVSRKDDLGQVATLLRSVDRKR